MGSETSSKFSCCEWPCDLSGPRFPPLWEGLMMQSKALGQPSSLVAGAPWRAPSLPGLSPGLRGVGGQDPAWTEGPARRQVWYTCHVPGAPTGTGLILTTARGGGDSVSFLQVRKPRCGGRPAEAEVEG